MRNTEFTQNYIGKWTQTPCRYESTTSTEKWYTSRGSGKSNIESALKWVYKAYGEDKFEYTYVTPSIKQSKPRLQESYPKGDLDKLLSFDPD